MPRTKVGSPKDTETVAPGEGCLALLRHLPFGPHLCHHINVRINLSMLIALDAGQLDIPSLTDEIRFADHYS